MPFVSKSWRGGGRRAVATVLIAGLVLGTGLVLFFAGLGAAASVAGLVSGLAAVIGAVVVWARPKPESAGIKDRGTGRGEPPLVHGSLAGRGSGGRNAPGPSEASGETPRGEPGDRARDRLRTRVRRLAGRLAPRRAIAVAGFAGVTVVALLVIISLVPGSPRAAQVPEVVGLSVQSAEKAVRSAGLRFTAAGNASSDAASVVAGTTPPPGSRVAAGSVVTLLISPAPKHAVKVPGVVGKLLGSAGAVLQGAGLLYTVKPDPGSLRPPGIVTRQDPVQGTPVSSGTSVTLYVPDGGRVPAVVGRSVGAAVTDLRNYGFGYQLAFVPFRQGTKPGTVVGQSPPGGARAIPGTTVTITIANSR
jgi:beta-lactam-binding protein with PASTA domain